MRTRHNVNEVNANPKGFSKNPNVIDNDRGGYARSKGVDIIADTLAAKFGNANYRDFYCKVAWKLPEARIWLNYEVASKGRNPARLFTYLCKKDGV